MNDTYFSIRTSSGDFHISVWLRGSPKHLLCIVKARGGGTLIFFGGGTYVLLRFLKNRGVLLETLVLKKSEPLTLMLVSD